jgi:hypothetical protein
MLTFWMSIASGQCLHHETQLQVQGSGPSQGDAYMSETSLTLRLTPGSLEERMLRTCLATLLAVNDGAGFVAVGSMNSAKGVDVARVFERPSVFSSFTKLFRTHSHELHIRGVGFPLVMSTPQLKARTTPFVWWTESTWSLP